MERKGKKLVPVLQQPPKRCPRCESTDTKFCYFNNYSRSQPRHYCKACQRYWTEGGVLRNVPPGGGGDRKSRRRKKTAAGAEPRVSAAPMQFDTANKSITDLSAGPVGAIPLHRQSSLFFMGGEVGEGLMGLLQSGNHARFHSGGGGIMADFGDQSSTMSPLMLPGFLNFPFAQKQNLLPLVEPSVIFPKVAASHCQVLPANSSTVLTTTTAGPSVSAEAGYTGEEGFWNVYGNGGGGVSAGLPPPQI